MATVSGPLYRELGHPILSSLDESILFKLQKACPCFVHFQGDIQRLWLASILGGFFLSGQTGLCGFSGAVRESHSQVPGYAGWKIVKLVMDYA